MTISQPSPLIMTVGHSTRTLDEYFRLLHALTPFAHVQGLEITYPAAAP